MTKSRKMGGERRTRGRYEKYNTSPRNISRKWGLLVRDAEQACHWWNWVQVLSVPSTCIIQCTKMTVLCGFARCIQLGFHLQLIQMYYLRYKLVFPVEPEANWITTRIMEFKRGWTTMGVIWGFNNGQHRYRTVCAATIFYLPIFVRW
jgi:hypothetical protein